MKDWNHYNLDKRTAEDIRESIRELSACYTPEWSFDTKNPDAGSVIAMIFANQMQENIRKFNFVLDKYRTELINMFGISLLPAKPACAVVVMEASDLADGILVPKGTKLLAETEGEKGQLVFETKQELFVTNSKLCEIIEISEKLGKFIQIFGPKIEFPVLENDLEEEQEEEDWEEISPYPIRLFDFSKPGILLNALILYHSFFFDTEQEEISICFHGSQPSSYYAEIFSNSKEYAFCYLSKKGLTPFEQVNRSEDKIILKKELENEKILENGKQYSVIVLEKKKPAQKPLELSGIFMDSSKDNAPPDFIISEESELSLEQAVIFGEELALYKECYIGQDKIFAKQGALITFCFELSFGEKELNVFSVEEEDLRLIKKKKQEYRFAVSDSWVQEISIEYYNGTGYKRLMCTPKASKIFSAEENSGICKIQFQAPKDWQPNGAGAFEGRCLRLRLLKADFCYMRPGRHHYPVLRNLQFSYHYQNNHIVPERVLQVQGRKRDDITSIFSEGKQAFVFPGFPYKGESILLGFDKKFTDAPVGLFFVFQNNVNFQGVSAEYEYSSAEGFKPLKVIDNTRNFTTSGILMFIPPADMALFSVEGRRRYWIRVKKKQEVLEEELKYYPVLEQIYCNAVEAANQETRETEEYFIDAAVPDMSFPLHAENILSAEVWVEEKEQLSSLQRTRLLEERPEAVRDEYNFLGEIEAFYVLWEEVESFQGSKAGDRHYRIDRMNHRILFGDGVSVKIPTSTKNAAFKVTLTCCDGEAGNVEADTILSSFSNRMFLNGVRNPFSAYGGGNLEKPENALIRGSNFLSYGKRIVSELDFIKEVRAFSDKVDKVRCILDRNREGEEKEGRISIVILMKDFEKGSYSFWALKRDLKRHLLERCEVTYSEKEIQIVEPVFVKISIQVWAVLEELGQVLEVKSKILSKITQFLDPLSGEQRNGWEIGRLPKEAQIRMLLNSMHFGAYIKNYTITLNYVDQDGIHETDLKSLEGNPFVVCMNGEHQVHILS